MISVLSDSMFSDMFASFKFLWNQEITSGQERRPVNGQGQPAGEIDMEQSDINEKQGEGEPLEASGMRQM